MVEPVDGAGGAIVSVDCIGVGAVESLQAEVATASNRTTDQRRREFRGWVCPLTPLENYFRQRGGSSTYEGEFIAHYIMPLLYPVHLTRHTQIWLGSFAVMVNVLLYWHIVRGWSRGRWTLGARGESPNKEGH